MKKILGLLTVAALAVAFVAVSPAHAATASDIQAMIAQLQAQLNSLTGGTSASAGYTFSTDLTIGSSGPDVTALQSWLIAKGYSIPAGATGYFGAQTQSALAAYQSASGISPAAGYFGPITRAAVNAAAMTSTGTTSTVPGCAAGAMFSATTGAACTGATVSAVPGCVAGAMFSSTTGQACGSSTVVTSSSGSITTPGAEGILTVTAGPISNTVVNVGQTQVPILTVRAQAQDSDIAIQRIQVDLGSNTTIYNKVYSNLYVVDNSTGNVLATVPLNSSTVVQSGSDYIANLTGFSLVVPKGTYKDIAIKADLYGSINTGYLGTYTVTVPANGVRGIDGAGQDDYGPTGQISQAITINASLVDNTIANISLDSASPQATTLPVTDTTNGNYLQLPILIFDIGAQNDAVHIHNLALNFTTTGTGSVTAAYLYQGSTQISSAAVTSLTSNSFTATFSNIQDGTAGASVPVDRTLPYTVKTDVTGVTGTFSVTASTTATGTTFYNSQDESVTTLNTNGINSTVGNQITVIKLGPAFTLNSSSIAVTGQNQNGGTVSTSTITATFSVSAQAIGTNVYFGTQASTTNPMFTFKVFNGAGSPVAPTALMASTSGFIVPSGTGFITTGLGTNSFELPQQQSGTLNNITFSFAGKDSTGAPLTAGPYSVEISKISYSNDNGTTISSQNYMDGQTAWRTAGINP